VNEKSWELAGLEGAGLIWLSTMSYKLTKLGRWKDLSKIPTKTNRHTTQSSKVDQCICNLRFPWFSSRLTSPKQSNANVKKDYTFCNSKTSSGCSGFGSQALRLDLWSSGTKTMWPYISEY
jgi:hypothetical protein